MQAYDRYAYTNNNPVRYIDASGHELLTFLLLAAAAAIVLTACSTASGPNEQQKQAAEQKILSTTVGLEFIRRGDGEKAYSLATNQGGGQLYGHNHYNETLDSKGQTYDALKTAATVNVYNSSGAQIGSFAGGSVTQLPNSITKGSSVLQLPNSLNGVGTASVTNTSIASLNAGQLIAAPRWNSNNASGGIGVTWGPVVNYQFDLGALPWNGDTQGGDSGGGTWTWINGQFCLIGNTLRGGGQIAKSLSYVEEP